MKLSILVFTTAALVLGVSAQSAQKPVTEPRPAKEVVASAVQTAKREGKNVFVVFHASWCGWCKRLDAFMNMPEFKPLFEKDYVVVHLTVLESPNKKGEENPGGEAYLDGLGGKNEGIPFFAILDGGGKMVANSMGKYPDKEKPSNIGHPMVKAEVDHFIFVLDKTAKRMTAAEKTTIRKHLESQKQ